VIELTVFGEGLAAIGLRLQRPVDLPMIDAYHHDLRDETDAAEWAAFVAVAVKRYRWEFFPSVPKLLEALEEFRASRAPVAGLLAVGGPTPDERRENLRLGASIIRAGLQERGLLAADAPDPVASMPKAGA
jgi:hypothetical protein